MNALTLIFSPVALKLIDKVFPGVSAATTTNATVQSKARFNSPALLDWRKAAPKSGESPKTIDVEPSMETPITETPITMPELMAIVPQDLVSRLMHVASSLAPEQREQALPLIQSIPRNLFPAVVKQLQAMTDDELTAQLRHTLGGASSCGRRGHAMKTRSWRSR